MVIFRLALKEKNEYTFAFDIKISEPYVTICLQCVHTKLHSLSKEVRKGCNVYVFKVVKRLVKNKVKFYFI